MHVIFLAENDPGLRQWLVYKEEIKFSYQILPSRRQEFRSHKILLNRGLKSALQKAAPDVIVCGGYNYLASWQAKSWAHRHQVPFVLWSESTDKDRRSRSRAIGLMKARFIRGCQAFVVPGKSSFEYVRKFGIAEKDIFLAPNAVDTELFARCAAAFREDAETERRRLQLPARFFLFVGRLVPEKGVFDLLDAYGKLNAEVRSEVGLVFVGEGPAGAELGRRSNRIAKGCVRYAGFAQREQSGELLRAGGDICVFSRIPILGDSW